jgi:2-iminobutanoate/2-iminopropanoate deaminase
MTRVIIDNPATVARPIGHYSHIAVVPATMETLYLAGQIGMMPDGSMPDDVNGQYEQSLRNIVAILEAHGAKPEHIVRLTSYVVKPLSLDHARATRLAILGPIAPPSTMLYVPRLATDDILIEIEATAVRPASAG